MTYRNIGPTYCYVHQYFHNEPAVMYLLAKNESGNHNNKPGTGRIKASVDMAGRMLERVGWVLL